MILTGAARLAGVMGWPVAHSRSPRIHGYWLKEKGIDGAYLPLAVRPEALLLDGRWDFVSPPPQSPPDAGCFDGAVRTVVGGDARCVSLAAASILAKVWRDRRMVRQAARYPAYDFDRNKGYPCPRHRAALAAWGPSAIHRRTWAYVRHLPSGAPTRPGPDPRLRLVEPR